MSANWVPWSAASLVSGAVLLVLGVLTFPLGGGTAELLDSLTLDGGRWLMGASAMILSALGLTLGMPALVWLMGSRTTPAGLVGLWVWTVGTIGLCAMGTMIVVLHTVVEVVDVSVEDAMTLLAEPSLTYYAYTVLTAFLVGELVVALSLARAQVVSGWVPALLVIHVVATPLVLTWVTVLAGPHAVLLGAALMGVASRASERWGTAQTA